METIMRTGGTYDAAGALLNAALWSVGWSGACLLAFGVMWLAGRVNPEVTWRTVIFLAVRIAFWGALTGSFFWGVLAALDRLHRSRPLAAISSARFGILGAAASAVFVPLTMQLFNLVSGDGLAAWHDVLDDLVWVMPLGGLAAVVTLKLAQRRARRAC
jgi:hypothetical protein